MRKLYRWAPALCAALALVAGGCEAAPTSISITKLVKTGEEPHKQADHTLGDPGKVAANNFGSVSISPRYPRWPTQGRQRINIDLHGVGTDVVPEIYGPSWMTRTGGPGNWRILVESGRPVGEHRFSVIAGNAAPAKGVVTVYSLPPPVRFSVVCGGEQNLRPVRDEWTTIGWCFVNDGDSDYDGYTWTASGGTLSSQSGRSVSVTIVNPSCGGSAVWVTARNPNWSASGIIRYSVNCSSERRG